ncbi:mannosylglycerate hydrolase [Falseniella ignava]|uniref:Glycoside hydrolase family 38 central domain-containing protein n=1 Tax=Falseniella ignava CCUG 37419 TaxID=883112 RepID=K1LG34_9LACT|nr:mannosylglycerate hydrolase [Falseniella ignava]EKB55615.1 hypothetical protein HMPREF9707_01103 [Falseniella ignava CCUG 37419]
MKKKKVHVIPHTHWDREWYFNTSRSTIYLLKHIKEVLNVLENDEKFKTYILDAQTSLVEDYLEYYPEDKERIQNLVKDERLFIGPWYTQTDQLVISQESIVRNLLYGIDKANEFGHSFNVGYVPDAFGQGGNMPQVYNSFGINTAVFWRGVADTTFDDTQFIWKGTDGSQVVTNIMRNGYHYGGEHGIPEDDSEMMEYINNFIGKLDKESNTNHIYFPYGHDQAPIRENLPELVDKFNSIDSEREYVMGNPESFFTELVDDYNSKLKSFSGELTQAKHSRVHKSIFSTRADMKQLNNKIENYLVNVLEPVLVIADSLGIEYPHAQVEKIWKLMFENVAHDSIGGCNSDSTNRDILHRYKVAEDLATNLLELTMRTISNKINFDHDLNIISFNPLPYDYEGIVEIEAYVPSLDFTLFNSKTGKEQDYVIEEAQELTEYVLNQTIQVDPSKDIYIPDKVYKVKLKAYLEDLLALGYQTFHIEPAKKHNETNHYKEDNGSTIENEKYHIKLRDDNTLTITDKATDTVYEKQMVFIDSGDDGDSYNYSPPKNDLLISSENSKRIDSNVYKNQLNQRLEYTFVMDVPYDLEERAKGEITSKLPVKASIDLEKGSEIIKFNIEVDNNVLSHKLSVQFDSDIASNFSYADQLFGPIRRPVYLEEEEVWVEEEWDEKPIAIEPMQSYVALSSDSEVFSVLTEGVREYEIVGENYSTIQLTLFRTFGYMGKKDLLYRPGRASGETIVETPDAQLLGKINCDFGIYINSQKGFNDINMSNISKEYLTDIPTYQNSDFLNGRMIFSQKREEKNLPEVYNLANFDVGNLGVSAIKASEKNSDYLIRVYNPYYDKSVEIPESFKNGSALELDETTEIDFPDKLGHNKFITIKVNK